MNKETLDPLRTDLIELMKKYNIRNASFCGTIDDGHLSLMSIQEKQDASGIFESAMNIGRLWQHTRDMIRNILDDFEK